MDEIRNKVKRINELSFELLTLLNDRELQAVTNRSLIHLMSPKRKKPKEGCIIQRKDGRFEGRYAQDKKVKSVYDRNYDKCLEKLNRCIKERDSTPKAISFGEWLEKWLHVYKENELKPVTYKNMCSCIKLHIPDTTKAKGLTSLNASDLKEILNATKNGRTKEDVYNIFSGCLKQALADRLIEYNPMLSIKPVNHQRKKGQALTVDEQRDFVSLLTGNELQDYYLFCLYSGCRRSEALGVTAEDIDIKNNKIHIRGTKTGGSDRYIPYFEQLRKLGCVKTFSGRLFNFSADHVTKVFKKLCPTHKLHDLRHTFATRCLEAGIPLKVVQAWLGHSTIDTTADFYTHVSVELHQEQAKKLDDFLNER